MIEINSLFIDSIKNQEELSYKLIKQLEKIAIDLDFKASYVYLDEDDLALKIFKKLDKNFCKKKALQGFQSVLTPIWAL